MIRSYHLKSDRCRPVVEACHKSETLTLPGGLAAAAFKIVVELLDRFRKSSTEPSNIAGGSRESI